MRISTTQKTTKLGTGLIFNIIDLRGKQGFPETQKGFAFSYEENRNIRCKYTGLPIYRKQQYVLRSDERGWRIDAMSSLHHGLIEAVYGVGGDRPAHWKSNHEAAKALVEVLDEIATCSSI